MKRSMSARQRRVAAMHMADYGKVMGKPVMGVIRYGGGLNIPQWIKDAEAQGYHATMTPRGVHLR